MLTENFLHGRPRDQLSDLELRVIENSIAEVRQFPARKTILRAGDKPDYSVFLIVGFICRYMDANDGKRQLVALQIPGDFVDLHAFPLTYFDHDNATIQLPENVSGKFVWGGQRIGLRGGQNRLILRNSEPVQ